MFNDHAPLSIRTAANLKISSMNLRRPPPLSRFGMLCLLWAVASVALPVFGFFDSSFYAVLTSIGIALSIPLIVPLMASGMSQQSVMLVVEAFQWLAIVIWAIVPAVAIALVFRRLSRGEYGMAATFALVPIFGIAFYFFGADTNDKLRFRLHKHEYDTILVEASATHCADNDKLFSVAVQGIACDPVTIIFPWSQAGGLSTGWSGVVYDAADEIIKAPKERSAVWSHRDIGNTLSCSRADLAFGDHYYRAHGDYSTFPGCTP